MKHDPNFQTGETQEVKTYFDLVSLWWTWGKGFSMPHSELYSVFITFQLKF